MSEVVEGVSAPKFDLPRDGGGNVSLAELSGKIVVLYFYPKDDTSGCTTEALDFTTLSGEFEAAGAVVVGVSPDSVKAHDKFIAKHDLTVPLATDAQEGGLSDKLGVWAEKKMYGRTFMGMVRTTILLAPDGTVARVWPKVKVKGHAEEVLEAVRNL